MISCPCPTDSKQVWSSWFIDQIKLRRPVYRFEEPYSNQMVWVNPKINSGFQIRTIARNLIVENKIEHWTLNVGGNWTSKVIVQMSIFVTSPWYINHRNNTIMLVDKEFSVILSMFNGDIKRCLESYI